MYYQYFSSMRVAETERQRMANFVNFLVEVEKMEEQVSLPLLLIFALLLFANARESYFVGRLLTPVLHCCAVLGHG
jgi:hypothetical protein